MPDFIIKLLAILLVLLISGGFGGLVFGLFTRRSYKVRVPGFENFLLELGFIGDILVGMVASMSVLFVASPLFNLELDTISEPSDYIQLMSLCIISGFAGIRLLSGISSQLLERISSVNERLDQAEKADRVLDVVRQADYLLEDDPKRALILYEKALSIDPQNESALIGKATAFRKQEHYREAIALLSRVIQNNSKADRAHYIRACYKNMVKEEYSKPNVLDDLKTAVSLSPLYKSYALEDKDFEDLRGDPEFSAIVGKIEKD